jgi:hypothetical protein
MKSMNAQVSVIKPEGLVEKMQEMVDFLCRAFEEGQAAHEVEEGIWWRVLGIGRQAFGAFVGLLGDGDAGEHVRLPDGREVKRLEERHRRQYQSVFGPFELIRAVYGSREGQRIEYVPLDEQLRLPQGKLSYLLQDWDQGLAVEMPYAKVSATLARMLGFKQSVHTLERNQREMAQAAPAFWREQPIPASEQEGAMLVCTADGKGVPMRGAGEVAGGAEPPTSSAMRPGTKKMALIGSVYSVDPYVRTPDEVLEALFRESPRDESLPPRPKPCFKSVRASLQRDAADRTAPQTQEIFSWMAQQVAQRNRGGEKPVILLMDGQHSLWDAGLQYLPQDTETLTDILDLLHATGYLWEAAHLFHPKGSAAARGFAKAQIRRILHGEVNAVIHSLRWQGTHHRLKGKRLETLEGICGYLRNNAHRMAYDVYLEHGFPIASGVIEGACRCVVKDRMERSGMRWIMPGARAMLDMRCIYLSDLWEEFREFRIQAESQRLYPGLAANDPDFSSLVAV